MKEHKKLYKSGKNWVVATLAVASLGVVAMQQGVSADSTPAVTTNTNEQNSVQTAQQEQTKAQADYDHQQQVVNEDQQAVRTAQDNVTSADTNLAKVQQSAKEATDSNINKTQAEINNQENEVKTAQTQLKEAQDKLNNKQSQSTDHHDDAAVTTNDGDVNNAQALQDSIEQNNLKLPDGYVDAFNNFNDNRADNLAKVSKASIYKLNPYHHSSSDAKVQIKDINNLDDDVTENLDLWYAGIMNDLLHNYDLRNSKGTLLRDDLNFNVTNYGIKTAKYINNLINKYTIDPRVDQLVNPSAGGVELYLITYDEYNNVELDSTQKDLAEALKQSQTDKDMVKYDQDKIALLKEQLQKSDKLYIPSNLKSRANVGKDGMMISPEEGDLKGDWEVRPTFLKAVDECIPNWGETKTTYGQEITNLDQLKEALWNNFILYNLINNTDEANMNDASFDFLDKNYETKEAGIKRLQSYERSGVDALFGDLASQDVDMMRPQLQDTKNFTFSFTVDKAGQITPHWYHIAKDHQGDADAQPLTITKANNVVTPHAADNQLEQLQADVKAKQTAYDQAKAKLDSLETKLAELQQAATNLKAAQAKANDAHRQLATAQQQLKADQAKLATLKLALDKANKKLNVAKAQAKVDTTQAAADKADNEYHAQEAIVSQDQQKVTDLENKVNNTSLWDNDKAQQLQKVMDQYAAENDLKILKFDGTHSLNTAGPNYADLSKYYVNGQKVTVEMSNDGQGNSDYNIVALYNHNLRNANASEFHDTYIFAFHNGQPVLLLDRTTNGDKIQTQTADNLNAAEREQYNIQALQASFAQTAGNNDELANQLQQAKDKLAADQAKLTELKATKTQADENYRQAKESLANAQGVKIPDTTDQTTPSDTENQHKDDNNQGPVTDNSQSQSTTEVTPNEQTDKQEVSSATSQGENVQKPVTGVVKGAEGQTVVNLTTQKNDAKKTNSSSVVNATKNVNNALPQTGNRESIAAIALGAVAAMFGLSLAKKREY